MFPGGGRGMNPRMMQQMMKQLGITVEELDDVERVVIETPTRHLVFTRPTVSAMRAQGQTTWQIVGDPEETAKGGGSAAAPQAIGSAGVGAGAEADEAGDDGEGAEEERGPLFTDDDVRLVAEQAKVPPSRAREALEQCDGEVAAAIVMLTEE